MAGSTNFKQWDEELNNLKTDGDYAVDPMRVGGAAPGIFPKETFNKAMLQVANFVAALAEAMAAKGYVVEDGSAGSPGHDFNALVTVLANLMTAADTVPNSANSALLAGLLPQSTNIKPFSSDFTNITPGNDYTAETDLIVVAWSNFSPSSLAGIYGIVDSIEVARGQIINPVANANAATIMFPVPKGSIYKVTITSPQGSFYSVKILPLGV